MTRLIHPADLSAAKHIFRIEPVWRGLETARNAFGLEDRTLLHAGPPVADPASLCTPLLNSAVMAVLFEGWASSPEAAERLVLSSAVRLEAAQDHHVVVPLADVLSPSMQVQVITDRDDTNAAYSPLNSGNGPAQRVGQRNDAILQHLRWLNGEFATVLARTLQEPIPLIGLADTGLAQGDDCHGRTPAATRELVEILAPRLGKDLAAEQCRAFLAESPGFFLNLWMAATKCILRAAEGRSGSSIVTAIGSNGSTFGIQLAGLADRWFMAPATAPLLPAATPAMISRSLGAIGDSAVVDAFGLGAMALDFAPETARSLASVVRADAHGLAKRLLVAEHPRFTRNRLPAVLPARAIVAERESIMISLGVLDNEGIDGRLGGGLYEPPVSVFEAACLALDMQIRPNE